MAGLSWAPSGIHVPPFATQTEQVSNSDISSQTPSPFPAFPLAPVLLSKTSKLSQQPTKPSLSVSTGSQTAQILAPGALKTTRPLSTGY